MRAHRTLFVTIFSSLVLVACGTPLPVHQPLPDAARADLASTDVVLPIQQSEIYVFVPVSTAGRAQGLIGAIIDSTVDSIRSSKAEAAVTPLRNAIVDFSFDDAFEDELKTTLAQVAWLHAGNFSVMRDVSGDNFTKTLGGSHAPAVLFVAADYRLSNDAAALMVTVEAALSPNNDQLRGLRAAKHDDQASWTMANALYRNRFVFEAHLASKGDRDANIARWSANKGAIARATLDMAAKKLASLIADDLQRNQSDIAPPANTPAAPVAVPAESTQCIYAPTSGAQCGAAGVLVSQDQDGQTLRFGDGSLKYIETGDL